MHILTRQRFRLACASAHTDQILCFFTHSLSFKESAGLSQNINSSYIAWIHRLVWIFAVYLYFKHLCDASHLFLISYKAYLEHGCLVDLLTVFLWL